VNEFDRHGYGYLFYQDGSKYEGNFFEDKRSGIGTMVFKDGNFFHG
jgi:hypothetical protein